MPRTTMLSKPKPYEKMMVLILGTAAANGVQTCELAPMAGISRSTLYARLRKPDAFTLAELTALGRGLHIPAEELRQTITY